MPKMSDTSSQNIKTTYLCSLHGRFDPRTFYSTDFRLSQPNISLESNNNKQKKKKIKNKKKKKKKKNVVP